jgi:hypothetical protein
VIADQAVVRGASAHADLVLGEPAVEEIAEVGLGSRGLEGVGLGQQTGNAFSASRRVAVVSCRMIRSPVAGSMPAETRAW